ncbi:MAG: hypothetical protein ACRERV_07040 [Methylococcales bacterium]
MIDTTNDELCFETQTPLAFQVRVTRRYWEFITTIKHPVMSGQEAEVQATLKNPDEIRQSQNDANVFLFYRLQKNKRWICAVTKRSNGIGFLITTYPTDAIKEGIRTWPK